MHMVADTAALCDLCDRVRVKCVGLTSQSMYLRTLNYPAKSDKWRTCSGDPGLKGAQRK